MRWLCLLVQMPELNVVLDPFAGSLTTAVACQTLGMASVSIEMNERYIKGGATRLSQQPLFTDDPAPEPEQLGL